MGTVTAELLIGFIWQVAGERKMLPKTGVGTSPW
jgi:hypothetical protein